MNEEDVVLIQDESGDIVIESEDFNISEEDLKAVSLDDTQIEGFFSALKKVARKASRIVRKVSKIPVVGSMIPPQMTMGANFLDKLVGVEKRTGKKIKLSVNTARVVNANAFLRGRLYEKKRMLKKLRGM